MGVGFKLLIINNLKTIHFSYLLKKSIPKSNHPSSFPVFRVIGVA